MAQSQLLEAIANDDSTNLKLNYSSSQESGMAWENNPLLIACENGNVEIVKALVELDPGLCLVTDGQFRTPLHIATIKGREEVVRVLVGACPMSLEKLTSLQETALHLALKHNQFGSFKVLMEQLQKLNQVGDINRMDHDGNTVLHIATSRKQIQILKLLLSHKSAIAPEVQVNSINRRGFTALDLYYQNHSDRIDKGISDLLHQAGAKEARLLNSFEVEGQPESYPQSQPESPYKMIQESMSSMTKSVLLAVFIFIAGAAYASVFNLNNIYAPLDNDHDQVDEFSTFNLKDMITVPNPLPGGFYFMVFNTVTFMGSMVVILVNTWSLVSKWSFCFRAVPLFVISAMFVSYALIMNKMMPKFSVAIGSHKISSFWVVWLYDLPLIFSTVAIWLIVKQILCILSKLAEDNFFGWGSV